MRSQTLLLALFLVSSSAITFRSAEDKLDAIEAPIPVPVKKCTAIDAAGCLADTCCNWCSLYFNSTIGFCMPVLPKPPSPSLTCQRTPPTCASLTTPTDCVTGATCKWIPMGPPTSPVGMCVYDWAACRAIPTDPADAAKAAAVPVIASLVAPPPAAAAQASLAAVDAAIAPPAATLTCNASTSATCDERPCCQWCQSAFPSPAAPAGFCMPALPRPVPTLTCSKPATAATCAAAADAAACAAAGPVCGWHPFGPPGTPGPGVCVFEWAKCAAA